MLIQAFISVPLINVENSIINTNNQIGQSDFSEKILSLKKTNTLQINPKYCPYFRSIEIGANI